MKHVRAITVFFLSFIVLIGYGQSDLSKPGTGHNDTNSKETVISKRLGALIPAKPSGRVSDFENVFTVKQVHYLDSIIGKNEENTSKEIAIVTLYLDSISIRSLNEFDEFSLALFNKWGIGNKKKKNGLGILFSVT